MIETMPGRERQSAATLIVPTFSQWPALLRDDLDRGFKRAGGRWSRAMLAIAWIHLLAFLACQALYDPTVHSDPRMVALWFAEFLAILSALQLIVGPKWWRTSTAIRIASRFWATFLILSFNLVMLNALIGWEVRWYKPAWGTLSTFFLASLAWLFTPRFFVAAVQMYFTALLMVQFKDYDNLIYGTSWWLILLVVAHSIRNTERQTPSFD